MVWFSAAATSLFRTRDNSDVRISIALVCTGAVHTYHLIDKAMRSFSLQVAASWLWVLKSNTHHALPWCLQSFFRQLSAHFLLETTLSGPGDLIFIPSGWWHCTVSRMGRKMEPVKLRAYNLSCGACWVQDWMNKMYWTCIYWCIDIFNDICLL